MSASCASRSGRAGSSATSRSFSRGSFRRTNASARGSSACSSGPARSRSPSPPGPLPRHLAADPPARLRPPARAALAVDPSGLEVRGFDAPHEANTIGAMGQTEKLGEQKQTTASKGVFVLGAEASRAGTALVRAIGRLVNRGIDEVLLSDKRRVTSAAEGRSLLSGDEQTESRTEDIQRVIVLAVPVLRALARGAHFVKLPWVIVGSTAISVGVAVRTGVREIQVLSSLVAHRLEQATGAPADPALVKKMALDLYLHPKREPRPTDDRLHLVRLTRKWVLGGIFGRKTSKRANRALAAAERLDPAALGERWDSVRRK